MEFRELTWYGMKPSTFIAERAWERLAWPVIVVRTVALLKRAGVPVNVMSEVKFTMPGVTITLVPVPVARSIAVGGVRGLCTCRDIDALIGD